jgi:hypothetical protein
MKNKSDMISLSAKKALDKFQHSFMIKRTLNKLAIKGMYLSTVKAIYDKLTANLILSDENLKDFSLRSGARQTYTFSPFLSSLVQEFLSRAFRQEKEIEGIQTGKEVVKLSLLTMCS